MHDERGAVEAIHASLNAAYNAIALDRRWGALARDVQLARDYVTEARDAALGMSATDGGAGGDGAGEPARAMLPRLERALQLTEQLDESRDGVAVQLLLDEIGVAMDDAEQLLANNRGRA